MTGGRVFSHIVSSRPQHPSAEEDALGDDVLDLPLSGAGPARPERGRRRAVPAPAEGAAEPAPAERPRASHGGRPGRVYRSGGAAGRRGDERHDRLPARPGRGLWLLLLVLLAVPLSAVVGYLARLSPGVVALSVDLVELGEVRVGSAGEPQSVEVVNRGEGRLTVGDAEITGTDTADFVVLRDDCAGRSLAGGQSCTLRLAFAPAALGERQARLEIPSDAPNSPTTVPLLGVGVASALVFEPARLEFAPQLVGSGSPTRTLAVVNGGTAPLSISAVGFDGLGRGAGDFVMRRDGCRGKVLPAGGRCELEIEFVPSAAGPRQAVLRLDSDAAAVVTMPRLAGVGAARVAKVRSEPAALVFAGIEVGARATPARLTLHNEGTGPLTVRGLRVEARREAAVADPAGASDDFSVEGGSCLGAPVPPGGSCAVTVTYHPSGEGDDRAVLVIAHQGAAAGEPDSERVPLAGVGTAPGLFVDPPRVVFGETPLHRGAARRELRLVSSGSAALTLEGLALEGGDAAAFAVRAEGCDGAIAPGAACRVTVSFQPRREGPHRAELRIAHGADEVPQVVPLNGIGTAARLVVEPSQLDFAQVQVGEEARRTLRLANAGRAPLAVDALRLEGLAAADYRLVDDGCTGVSLGADERCTATVVFRPGARGTRGASLTIVHDAAERPARVELVATGVPAPAPQAALVPDELDFGGVTVEGRSTIATVTVRNAGNARLGLGEFHVVGRDADAFRVVAGSCAGVDYVAAGGECSVGVRFEPLAAGGHEAALVVEQDAGVETRVELRGRGVEGPY